MKKKRQQYHIDSYEDLVKTVKSAARTAADELGGDLDTLKEQGKDALGEARTQAGPLVQAARKRLEHARAEMEEKGTDLVEAATKAQRDATKKGKKVSKRTAAKMEKAADKAAKKAANKFGKKKHCPCTGSCRTFTVVTLVALLLGCVAFVVRKLWFSEEEVGTEVPRVTPMEPEAKVETEESVLRYSTVTPTEAEEAAEATEEKPTEN